MSRAPVHPESATLELGRVLSCLGDPLRLTIVKRIAEAEAEAKTLRCRDFSDLGPKSSLSYHLEKMRDAGILNITLSGTSRYLNIRRTDLEERFPRLLDTIMASA